MDIKIKKAELADSDLVFNLTKRAFQHYNDPSLFPTTPALLETREDVKREIKKKEILIAYLNNKPVGSVRYHSSDGETFYLSRLGVLAKYQNRNVGQRLINEVEARVKAKGGKRVTLYSAYRLKGLLDFYKSLGYKVVDLKEDADYTRAVISKELNTEGSEDDKEEEGYEIMGR
ncbi:MULTISPECIES: GNAT family N-acetyltransferase [unclassified Candidatus Frackibacter]|uniref:GNAT family N-acetyltransferase n=1 Tax=unclassified Candidatus Frackibacter TaxID=2648818 RepID=UPI000798226E|nr:MULTISPECIES: GNAT family N-acetyltransferase [unclassified Candidatus Frackibacter]KXS44930.1 MAG: N-acetyltransferase GCN5 [Candidatus Frackibacter sp. T328-2]SDB97251.1 Predicted N-acetyltransferase YhbS [Candidatus Frackibacter sp. WG11]SEM28930.1 Predicted N-acetyltransferase YhbS [Candidatus Frackibacter sp. WG12]SFL33769.1 Predicted N-acetyltransferase YhbS [Candidatus Frackibacter sp. WG13]